MKTKINKYRHAILPVMMIVLNSVVAFATTPWTVNPSDYRYDMSLYLKVTFPSEEMDYSLYGLGVFSGDECRGVAEVLNLSNGKDCLYLRARSNVEHGETMTFKYYNKETGNVSPIEGVTFQFQSNGRLGYPSDPFLIAMTHEQTLGDVNGDSEINVADITGIAACILGSADSGLRIEAADVNQDGEINVADITTLATYILTGSFKQ